MDEFKNLYTRHLTRIEHLARRLLQHQYESAQDLWTIQTDLVRYQIEVRAEIREAQSEKSKTQTAIAAVAARRESDWKNELRSLQAKIRSAEIRESILDHALSLSKQFGDAFAWIFLKGDVHRIRALAINKPNPPVPDGLSLEAMLGVAKSFANAGAGFPLIHDVTSILRVGDLTFRNVLDSDDEPLTVEVKSRLQMFRGTLLPLTSRSTRLPFSLNSRLCWKS